MKMTEQKKEKLRQIVYDSRARILAYRPVYALLLMCLTVVLDENIGTVSVNENCIFINPNFLQKLHAKEVDFVLLHQLYHVINGDIWR
jgi:predicted metal-dependent peptidase